MSDEKDKDLVEALASGATINEVREEMDLPPLGEVGDQPLNPTYVEAVKAKKKERPAPPQMITFDRYFLSLGKPGHHRAGMEAYTNTKGKKTREAWEALFKHY